MIESTKDGAIIKEHSRDVSVFCIEPEEVFYPKSAEEIQVILKQAELEKTTVTVRAGGTCMSGGSLNDGKVINLTKYMNTLGTVDLLRPTDISTGEPALYAVTVEMGAMYRDIEKLADGHGLVFGAYTSSKDICGIGGMIGNNASGEKSVRLGATIDNVLGLEVVLGDGTIIRTGLMENTGESLKSMLKATDIKKELLSLRTSLGNRLDDAIGEVPKAASGYRLERIIEMNNSIDLTPIFVGAQGTLGIVTKAMLKLVPKPDHIGLMVVSVDRLEQLPFILKTVMAHNPEGVETFDINTFNRAEKALPEQFIACKSFFEGDTRLVVLAQFSEPSEGETHQTALACKQELNTQGARTTVVEDTHLFDSIWKIRRSSFTLMRDNNPEGAIAVPCIEDIIVPIDRFDVFVPALMALLEKYQISYGFHGHIGDGSLRIVPIFDLHLGREVVIEKIIEFTREAMLLIKSLHGNISADHSDGIIRTPFIREFYGEEVYGAFVKVKDILDPKRVLNKNKKVDGTFDHIKKYFIR